MNVKYIAPYYIKGVSHRQLLLVHLSQHQIAHNEMIEEHWGNSNINLNHQGYVGVSPIILGFDEQYDGQFSSFTEDYFETQRNHTTEIITCQIQIILYKNGDISYEKLSSLLRKTAPVTIEIITQSIDTLAKSKMIMIDGRYVSGCKSNLKKENIIGISPQKEFWPFNTK